MHKIAFILSAFLLISCNSGSPAEANTEAKKTSQIEVLQEEVMAVHDRVMPKMNPMAQQQKKLRTASKQHEDSAQYINTAMQLRQAQELMMNWMHQYKVPEEQNWSDTEAVHYLERQKQRMLEIESFTQKAMGKADSLLAL